MVGTPGGPYNPSEASHQALRAIRRALDRHPAVTTVQGFPHDGYSTNVIGEIATNQFDIDGESATLTVSWFAGETPDAKPHFSFHYSDGVEDFGWHHEPNPHVDGWGHYQERPDSNTDYTYEAHSFTSQEPARVVWEVMELLTAALSE